MKATRFWRNIMITSGARSVMMTGSSYRTDPKPWEDFQRAEECAGREEDTGRVWLL